MPIYLDEDMVGQDPAEICYPHLELCMGVTVLMQDGSLIGAHFTKPTTETELSAEMLKQISAHSSKMHQLYCAGNFPIHIVAHGGMKLEDKARSLGFHGNAYSFDTSLINPDHGTFVAVRSNGPGNRCTLYYKRDEKARKVYQRGQGGPVVTKVTPAGWYNPLAGAKVRQDNAFTLGLSKPIHKLHEASYKPDMLLRIEHHTIP